MLEMRAVSVSYGADEVVRDVSFALRDDEILMLVGPTGCGKTTVLRTLAGLVRPARGELVIDDQRIDRRHDVPPERRGLGMVFQDFALFPHLTVAENVAFRLADRGPAERWLAQLGLEALRDAMPATLSGGQKQRVSLARALAHEPRALLLDEPLSNLDESLKDTLRGEIASALRLAGVPAIWVTHDQEEALSVGDRIGIMNDGRIEQLDTPERCFCAPVSRFVAGFLGEASWLPGELAGDRVDTAIGSVPARPIAAASGAVEVLVRPDDLSLAADSTGSGCVVWQRYEGGTRLYGVRLEHGAVLQARVSHELQLQPGDAVVASLATQHPLAVFPGL